LQRAGHFSVNIAACAGLDAERATLARTLASDLPVLIALPWCAGTLLEAWEIAASQRIHDLLR
jgi:hypothetical protein